MPRNVHQELLKSSVTYTDANAVMSTIERIVAPLGRRIDESSPMVDARLKDGSLTTLHANSPRDSIGRMEVLVMMAGMDLAVTAIREQIASAVDLIVQQTRFPCGSRRVTSITEVTGVESGRIQLAEIFRFNRRGYLEGKTQGEFVATGQVPEFYEALRERGVELDMSIFNHA